MSDAVGRSDFAQAVLTGLSQRQKVIPARFFYDRRGSELFEKITLQPEYYPTRVEVSLLQTHAAEIARRTGKVHAVVEFGSGSSNKTPLLLREVAPAAYVPIDIAADFLAESARILAAAQPGLEVLPVAADFTKPFSLPASVEGRSLLGFFPGSTIGNLTAAPAVDLLRSFRLLLGEDAHLVIGIDLVKDARLLEAAYDDAQGATAAFNLNLLDRINRELGGTLPVRAFTHRALWNDRLGRMEMHLVAARSITFEVAGRAFAMEEGEAIHTENSHKYRQEEIALLARASGWDPIDAWTDAERSFSLNLWKAPPVQMEP